MSNGGRRIVYNTRERLISNDHNRAQAIQAQARATYLARHFGDRYSADLPGYAPQTIVGGASPMVADVYGGLMVLVDDPNSLFVQAGVVGVVDPETIPDIDDDPYKMIDDPGVSTAGVLPFLANATGSIRMELIVADVVDQVLETDNRDIYDPATGTFTPFTVTKVSAKRLSYAIVRGVAGSGLPAIPNRIVLAVASVPDGATDWSDVTFWDVRPLVHDRVPSSGRRRWWFDFSAISSGDHNGEIWTEYGGYLAGGTLKRSVPGGDADFDSGDANQSTNGFAYRGTSSGASDVGANPVFALFPAGLPRWARYSEGAAPGLLIRAPYGPLGILVGGRGNPTDKAKVDDYGIASAVPLPAITGLTGTADGVLLWMAHVRANPGGGGTFVPAQGIGNSILFAAEYASTDQDRVRLTANSSADADEQAWNIGSLARDSNSIGVPSLLKEILVGWQPATLQPSSGTAPPDAAAYDQLALFVRDDVYEHTHLFAQQVGLGDGSNVPAVMAAPPVWLPIRYNPASPPTVGITTGICRSGGTPGVFESQWRFDGSSSSLLILGYKM